MKKFNFILSKIKNNFKKPNSSILFLTCLFLLLTTIIVANQQDRKISKSRAQTTAIKIMVVGDSISQGHSGDYTWRYRLWQHFASSGATVDFVGPKNTVYDDTNPNSTDYLDPNFDNEHDATWGRPAIYEKDTIASEMQSATPDVLLVDLGTNDLVWGYSDVAGALDSMRTLIINARSINPNVKIVLSLLTPRTVPANDPWITNRTNYNAGLQTLSSQMTTAESPVVISDPTNGFDDTVDTYDGTHPTPSGEYKIAAGFADALSTNFGIGPLFGQIPPAPAWPQASTITNVSPGNGEATITWNPVPGASGYYIHVRNVTRGESFTRLPYAIAGPTFTGGYLINGETYEFAVSTTRGNVDGPISTPIQVTPRAPTPTPTLTPTSMPSPTPQPIVTTNFYPTADTYVNSSATGTNYGKLTYFLVDASPINRAYLKFDLSPLKGKTILYAYLKLRVPGGTYDSSVGAQSIRLSNNTLTTGAQWTETNVNYNNKPGIGSTTIGTISSGNKLNVLLTSTKITDSGFKAKAGQIMSLSIIQTSTDGIKFYSREYNTTYDPVLVVTYQ